MAKRKEKTADAFVYCYVTVDDWVREYRFETNYRPQEFDADYHSERDEIHNAGRLRAKTE